MNILSHLSGEVQNKIIVLKQFLFPRTWKRNNILATPQEMCNSNSTHSYKCKCNAKADNQKHVTFQNWGLKDLSRYITMCSSHCYLNISHMWLQLIRLTIWPIKCQQTLYMVLNLFQTEIIPQVMHTSLIVQPSTKFPIYPKINITSNEANF